MTESELVNLFGTTWMELNRRLQTLMKSLNLHHNEKSAGEEEVIKEGEHRLCTLSDIPVWQHG